MTYEHRWWEPLWHFAVHSLVGSVLFGIIAFPALVLNVVVHRLETVADAPIVVWGFHVVASPLLIAGLKLAEYGLFFLDLALFLIFIARMGWKALKALW